MKTFSANAFINVYVKARKIKYKQHKFKFLNLITMHSRLVDKLQKYWQLALQDYNYPTT